jgi:hypothetical protein
MIYRSLPCSPSPTQPDCPARLILKAFASRYCALPATNMDSNGFSSTNQNALQQRALTDFFVPDQESNLLQACLLWLSPARMLATMNLSVLICIP